MKERIADSDSLITRLENQLTVPKVNPEHEARKRDREAFRQKQIREEEEAHACWMAFWQELANEPDAAFSEGRLANTTSDLWEAMKRSGKEGRESGWNRQFIEQHFGKKTTDRLRESLMNSWRNDRPTFRSERPPEKKSQWLMRWELGLAGIAAESEDPSWAVPLTNEEVSLAIRYALLATGGLPDWLKTLATKHPDVVEEVLGHECVCELEELADQNGHFFLLQKFRHAVAEIQKLLVPRIYDWFTQNHSQIRHGEISHKVISRLSDATQILLEHGTQTVRDGVRCAAVKKLSSDIEPDHVGFWLSTLMQIDPNAGVAHLERVLAAPSQAGVAEGLIGHLFGDFSGMSNARLGLHTFKSSVLLRLVKLAYREIKTSEDTDRKKHSNSDTRASAQRGRGNLLNALLAKEGPDAWAAKVEMANDPVFSHFRDRALALVLEKTAEEMDAEEFTEKEIASLRSNHEAPPKTQESMFRVLVDRLDDLGEVLRHDDSPRGGWALIEDEKTMRQMIARELNSNAKGAYKVDQEGVTADEKETDIRLRSTASEQQAVIELKLGENHSGPVLFDTLRNQIVTKYMADETCRSGCLLITIANDRQWQHPKTQKLIDVTELKEFLQKEANTIESEMGHSLRLTVKVLDLRPRLKTEKET